MSPPEKAEGPAADRTQETATTTQPARAYPSHETYMAQLASRIRWLEHRRHWWLRTPEGRSQLEFIERRDAA